MINPVWGALIVFVGLELTFIIIDAVDRAWVRWQAQKSKPKPRHNEYEAPGRHF